jgi:hypothetical protein
MGHGGAVPLRVPGPRVIAGISEGCQGDGAVVEMDGWTVFARVGAGLRLAPTKTPRA